MQKEKFIPSKKRIFRLSEIVSYAEGKNVLNVGMGGYVDNIEETERIFNRNPKDNLHLHVAKVANSWVGLDINPLAIEAMRNLVPGNYFTGDITDTTLPSKIGKKFNCIVLGEVLEHLDCLRTTLKNIHEMLTPDGNTIITIPNAFSLESIIKMLFRYESCHEEHTSYFSYLTIKRLLSINHFEIVDFNFSIAKREIFGSLFSRLSYYSMIIVTKFMPQFSQGLLIVAKPR